MSKDKRTERTDFQSGGLHRKRRDFLKKSAYAAPTLIAMGQLIKPQKANAFGPPPSDPNTGGW